MESQQSIMDQAYRIAVAQADPHSSSVIDAAFLTEDDFITALTEAVIEQGFQRSYVLSVVDGKVDLPAGIILKKVSTATVYAEDPTELSSFEERYIDYLNFSYPQLSRFTVRDSTLCYTEADGDIDDFTGDLNFNSVALPDIPDVLTDEIIIPDTLADRCAGILANMMVGK